MLFGDEVFKTSILGSNFPRSSADVTSGDGECALLMGRNQAQL